jgi:hypothetical protein
MLDEESAAFAHHLPADNENDCVLASATATGAVWLWLQGNVLSISHPRFV